MSIVVADLTSEEKADLLVELKRAIASGAVEVEFRERRVRYRSLRDMMVIRDDLEAQLGVKPARRQVIMTSFGRGF